MSPQKMQLVDSDELPSVAKEMTQRVSSRRGSRNAASLSLSRAGHRSAPGSAAAKRPAAKGPAAKGDTKTTPFQKLAEEIELVSVAVDELAEEKRQMERESVQVTAGEWLKGNAQQGCWESSVPTLPSIAPP